MNFENCNKAVILNRMSARIMKNNSIQTNAGFMLNQADAKNFIVGQNTLNGVMLGIYKSGNESSINGGFAGFNNNITLAQYPFLQGFVSGQNINYSLKNGETAEFVIYDVLGSKLQTISLNDIKEIETIDLSAYTSGIYTYQYIREGHANQVGKIVISK